MSGKLSCLFTLEMWKGGRQNNSRQTSRMIYFGNNNNVLLTDSCITKTCRQNYVHSTMTMACTKLGEHFFMD